jgi:eukaryotic-like serine/threonine-protein kinase
VLDFGIAKVRGLEAVQTREGIMVGTPAYMSREQVLGGRAVDHHADLWAMAVIAYECLEGELPYLAATMSEVFVQIAAPGGLLRRPLASPSFASWFERATAPAPEQRFASAPELVEALASALGVQAPSSMAGQAPSLDDGATEGARPLRCSS